MRVYIWDVKYPIDILIYFNSSDNYVILEGLDKFYYNIKYPPFIGPYICPNVEIPNKKPRFS